VKGFYELIAEELPAPTFRFLNYGYAEPSVRRYRWIRADDRPYKYHLSLVRKVLHGLRLKGKRVLEVGCGRGGNCEYLMRYRQARFVAGVDLCRPNVEFCRRVYELPGLHFVCADAGRLPLADGSFDAVLSLESSHGYPRLDLFLAEVWRVLAPGGILAYADFWDLAVVAQDWKGREEILRNAPFETLAEEDITEQVFRALKSDSGLSAILRSMRNERNEATVDWLVQANEAMRLSLASRQSVYRVWRLRRR